jgi:hypothetical protein
MGRVARCRLRVLCQCAGRPARSRGCESPTGKRGAGDRLRRPGARGEIPWAYSAIASPRTRRIAVIVWVQRLAAFGSSAGPWPRRGRAAGNWRDDFTTACQFQHDTVSNPPILADIIIQVRASAALRSRASRNAVVVLDCDFVHPSCHAQPVVLGVCANTGWRCAQDGIAKDPRGQPSIAD